MPRQTHISSFPHIERRRSERLPFRETVFVCGQSHGRSFKEETLTLSISAHGALVDLSASLSRGQKLLLMNPQTWDEREAHVARVGNVRNGRTEVALKFTKPAPEFWPLNTTLQSFSLRQKIEAVLSATPPSIPIQSLTYK
jgi:hypothetical protein